MLALFCLEMYSCNIFVFSVIQDDMGADKENTVLPPGGGVPTVKNNEENMIDNPYLRPVKKPKVRRKK